MRLTSTGGASGPEVGRSCESCESWQLAAFFFSTILLYSLCAGLLPGGVGNIVGRMVCSLQGCDLMRTCVEALCVLWSRTLECFTVTLSSGNKIQSSTGVAVFVLWTTTFRSLFFVASVLSSFCWVCMVAPGSMKAIEGVDNEVKARLTQVTAMWNNDYTGAQCHYRKAQNQCLG